ncbi:MAG: hypothetical protein ACLPKB_03390 [Xanthobacteraceae bacterium]
MIRGGAFAKLIRVVGGNRLLVIAIVAAACAAVALTGDPARAVPPQEPLIASLTLVDGDRATIETAREPDGRMKAVVRGDFYDGRRLIRALLRTPRGSMPPVDLDIKVATLLGFNGETFRDFELNISSRGDEITSFVVTATVGDGERLKGELRNVPPDNRRMIYLESGNAGAFFRSIDVYQRLRGGRMRAGMDTKNGIVDVRDFAVVDQAGLKPFISPIDKLGRQVPNELQFSRLRMDLKSFTGRIDIADGLMTGDGDTVVTLGAGETITIIGVAAESLGANNFVFNQTFTSYNAGSMTVDNGAMLPLGGMVDNSGTIYLGSTGAETDLEVVGSATLQGGGQIVLSDSSANVIYGASANTTLTNVDNTISGAGQIGDGQLDLINEGTINADGKNALIINTGSNVVVNSGTFEATGAGGLIIESAVANSGNLWASGGNLQAQAAVTGDGSATIAAGTLEFGAASDVSTTFNGNAGTLKLDASSGFTGRVSGFGGEDGIDLSDIGFGAQTTLGYAQNQNNTGGTLTVSDGVHAANLALLGNYIAASFVTASDGHGGTLVTDPALIAAASPLSLTQPHA